LERNPDLVQQQITAPNWGGGQSLGRAPGSRPEWTDSVFEDFLGGTIQNALQRNCPTQPSSGCMTSFGNPEALGFFPMPTIEEASGL
jgi:hypothetical protein